MQIDRLYIRGNGKDFDFVPGKVNTFFGDNAAGKTTLLEGIRYLMTGSTPVPTMSVQATADLAHISREKEDGYHVKSKIEGKTVASSAVDSFLAEKMNSDPATVKMQSVQEIVFTDPKKMMSTILSRIPQNLTVDLVKEYCGKITPEEAGKIDDYFKSVPKENGKFGISQMEKAGVYFHNERLVHQRIVNDLTIKLKGYPVCKTVQKTAEEIDTDIMKAAASETESDYMERLHQWERLKLAEDRKKKEIENLNNQMNAIKIKKEPPASYREEAATGLEKSLASVAANQKTTAVLEANIQSFEKILSVLKTDICPISALSQGKLTIRCTVDKTSTIADISETLEKNRSALMETKGTIKKLEEDICDFRKKISDFEGWMSEYRKYIDLTEKINLLKNTSEVIIPEKPIWNKPEFDINVLKRMKDECQKWQEAESMREKIREEEKQVELNASLEEKLSKDAKSAFIKHYIDVLSDELDKSIRQLGDHEAKFVCKNDEISMMVRPKGAVSFRDVTQLSTGECLVTSIAISILMNQLSRSGVLLIDNVEALDSRSLEKLKGILNDKKFLKNFDHVFVCGVGHEEVIRILSGIKDAKKIN